MADEIYTDDIVAAALAGEDLEEPELELAEDEEALELDEITEQVLGQCLEEASNYLEQLAEFQPFTILVQGENMFVEGHAGEDPVEQRASAVNAIRTLTGASHYAFCYDGYIESEDEAGNPVELDAIIIEYADREMEAANVVACMYTMDDEYLELDDSLMLADTTALLWPVAPAEAPEPAEDELEQFLGLKED